LPDHKHPYKDLRYYDEYGKNKEGYDKTAATPGGDENGGLRDVPRNTFANKDFKGEPFSLIQPAVVMNFVIKFK
jgi:hypothetical protein